MPTWTAVRCSTLGSLSDDDGDGNEDRKKSIRFRLKTTFHVHHLFCVRLQRESLVDDVNTRQWLSFSFPELWYSLLEFTQEKFQCQHLTNWTSWNKNDKVWSSAKTFYKWRFRSSRHVCCSSTLATVWTATVQTWTSRSHTSNILPERLVERVWGTRSQSSVDSSSRSYLSTSGPNIRSHCTKVWHRTYPIYDAPFSRSARRSFAPLQKSCRNFCVCKQERMLQINACVVGIDYLPS